MIFIGKVRMSNLELLRVVAMIFIMFGHSSLRINALPTSDAFVTNPLYSFLAIMSGCIATTGVGIFIVISGWFGIRFSGKGLLKYLFQVFFLLWLIYGIAIVSGSSEFNSSGVKYSLCFYDGYWFVLAYLGLYLASPVLNLFIEHAKKKDFQIVLISYFLFQSVYSWLSAWYDYYNGYSIIMFCGIYLTAAYIRKFPVDWIFRNSWQLLFATILIMSIIASLSTWLFGNAGRQIRDDNPLVIFACILFVMCFSKIKLQSKVVNWLAASCFAVYLIHYSPFVYPYFMSLVRYVNDIFTGWMSLPAMLTTLLVAFLLCTLFDQIRIWLWKLFIIKFDKEEVVKDKGQRR